MNCDGKMESHELSKAEQYILLFLSDGEPKRFSQIYNYLKSKGIRMSGQLLIWKLNKLMKLKFVFPRPHPTKNNAKTYQITPLYVRMPEDHTVVVHSPAFRRPVVIIPAEYKEKINVKEIVKKGSEKIISKIENGHVKHEEIVELLMGYRE